MDEETFKLAANARLCDEVIVVDGLGLKITDSLLEGLPNAKGLVLIDADWLWEKFVE